MVSNLDEVDPGFLADLEESKEAVWIAARWLSDRGMTVTIPYTNVRPNPSQRFSYSDKGDLFASRAGIDYRIEVKKRKLDFSSAEDFLYDTIFVDVDYRWDDAEVKPYAYMLFNKTLTAFFWVVGESHIIWRKTTRFDTNCNRERTFYECPTTNIPVFQIGG